MSASYGRKEEGRGVGWPQAIAMAVRSAARDEDEVLGVRATCEIRDRRLRRAKDRAERTRLDRAKALAEAERRRQKRAREARSETRAREDQARKQWEEKEKRRQSAAEQRRRLSLTLVQRKKRFEDDRREAALRRRQELERHPRTTTTAARTNPKLSSRVPPSQPALAPSRSFPNRRSKDGVSGGGVKRPLADLSWSDHNRRGAEAEAAPLDLDCLSVSLRRAIVGSTGTPGPSPSPHSGGDGEGISCQPPEADEEIRPRDHAVCVPAPVPAPIPTDGGDFATRLDRLVLEIERGEYRRLKTEGSCADFGGRLSLRRRHETERKEVARKFEDLLLTTTP